MEAEIRAKHLLAKDCKGLLATPRNQERGMEQILPIALREATHSDFRLLASRTIYEKKFTLF